MHGFSHIGDVVHPDANDVSVFCTAGRSKVCEARSSTRVIVVPHGPPDKKKLWQQVDAYVSWCSGCIKNVNGVRFGYEDILMNKERQTNASKSCFTYGILIGAFGSSLPTLSVSQSYILSWHIRRETRTACRQGVRTSNCTKVCW